MALSLGKKPIIERESNIAATKKKKEDSSQAFFGTRGKNKVNYFETFCRTYATFCSCTNYKMLYQQLMFSLSC